MICFGIDAATGLAVEVQFGETIEEVRPFTGPSDGLPYLAPGFVDIQVNGFAGVDFNNPAATVEDLDLAVETILTTGTTRFLPTVITGGPDAMAGCLRNVWTNRTRLRHPDAIAGFHVEGPFIDAEDGPRGAHPVQWVRPPNLEEYRRWQDATEGHIRLVTLSPTWPEAPAWISAVAKEGVAVSIGHTGASADRIAAAVDAGATLSTHLGNGAHQVLRRHPNYIWEQMAEDRLSASFIVDGIHLGRAFLRTALRAKTAERSVLVTDASAPAGAPPGRYMLGDQPADHTADGRVVLAGTDKLAGSALRMHDGVANMVTLGGLSLADAVRTATVNPARMVQLEGRMRGLAPGDLADLVLFRFDGRLRLDATYIGGVKLQ